MGTKTGSSMPAAERSSTDLDLALRTLAKPDRRSVLERMCDHGGPIVAAELAAALADADSPAERDRILRTLRHIHLPKLTEAGLIEYDRATETAVPTDHGEAILATLDRSLA